jgi:hypothetical protein
MRLHFFKKKIKNPCDMTSRRKKHFEISEREQWGETRQKTKNMEK